MKKLFLAGLFALGLGSVANAQIQKGNWMVGGDLISSNFGLNTGGGYNFAVQPKAAYFVKDNLAIGGLIDLGFAGAKGSSTTFTYNVGPMARYYFNNGEVDNLLKHGRFFAEANVGIGGVTMSQGGDSANGLNLGVGPGYAYFITPNIGLEGLVKYNGNYGFGNRGNVSAITFNVGFQIYLPTSKAKQIIKDVN